MWVRPDADVRWKGPFATFQRIFSIAYLLMALSDWMQGPYLYEVYSRHGYTHQEIMAFMVIGFASSLVLGTMVTGAADVLGRKAICMVSGVLFVASCGAMHFTSRAVLVFGRAASGAATTILMTAFETWMMHEHNKAGFPPERVSDTLSLMAYGSGATAIVGGVLANGLVACFGSPVVAFDGAAVAALASLVFIAKRWDENVGTHNMRVCDTVRQAWGTAVSDAGVRVVALMQACFESSMYIVAVLWAPVLSDMTPYLSLGLLFAHLMLCNMLGGLAFQVLSNRGVSVVFLLRVALALSTASLVLVSVVIQLAYLKHTFVAMVACLSVFEVCCGLYFPSIGTIRGHVIPSRVRASVTSLCRAGVNVLVIILLATNTQLGASWTFAVCGCHLFAAVVVATHLPHARSAPTKQPWSNVV